jgi:hypothetical protein
LLRWKSAILHCCICDLQITGERFQNSSRCANQVPVAEQKRYGHFPYYKREPIDFKKQKLYFRHVLAISNAKIMIYLYVNKVWFESLPCLLSNHR